MSADIVVRSLRDDPSLEPAFVNMGTTWPRFVQPSPLLVEWGLVEHRQHQLALLAEDRLLARAAALPLSWDGDPSRLPLRGWDEVVERSVVGTFTGADLTTLCALEVSVATGHEGKGLSSIALTALRDHARRAGFDRLIAPVRPTGKARCPDVPMPEYVARRRPDGLPVDPWLRIHERLGGHVIGICPSAMTVVAPLQQWRDWTRLPLTKTGPVTVPGGIAPVLVNVEHDYATYVEANVWVFHDISAR